jgi:hypothetical protein
VRHVLHAVAIDPSYASSVGLVADTIVRALAHARERAARFGPPITAAPD